MIQFLGLHLDAGTATTVVLGRDLRISARFATRVQNAVADAATGVSEVPVGEWVRAGCYALQEAYFALAVKERKAWGLGLAGPMGWIVLDVEYEPLSPLRITGGVPPLEDLHRWLEANPRAAKKVAVVLSPKDYFRFMVSGGLAADVSTASRMGLLQDARSLWSKERAAERRIPLHWLPPVFDGGVTTGRLSEEGIRRTGLPGGLWLVAGAHEDEAAVVAAGDPRAATLYILSRGGGRPRLLARGVPRARLDARLAGWRAVAGPLEEHGMLERDLPRHGEPASVPALLEGDLHHPRWQYTQELSVLGDHEGGQLDDLARAREELAAAGVGADAVVEAEAKPADGAAALAAVGSGLARGWDRYYRDRVVA